MTGRKVLTWKGALALGLLLIAALGALWALSRRPAGQVAVVERSGEVLAWVELSALDQPREEVFSGENGHSFTVAFSREGARVLRADCPDQVCVRTGLLTRTGEAAVCVPARLVLRLEGGGSAENDGIDGVTG